MSWGLGWKRLSETFHLTLNYTGGDEEVEDLSRPSSEDQESGFRIELDWTAGDDEDQVALRLQSQLMVALPMPQDSVVVELKEREGDGGNVGVDMKVVKRRDPLRVVKMSKPVGSGQLSDGIGVVTRLMRSGVKDGAAACNEHWNNVTVLDFCGCSLSVSPQNNSSFSDYGFSVFIILMLYGDLNLLHDSICGFFWLLGERF